MTTTLNFTGTMIRSGRYVCRIPVEIDFRYDPVAEPLAVEASISSPNIEEGVVVWVFARDLLVTAANTLTGVGEGDVKFRRDEEVGVMFFCIKNPETLSHADFELPLQSVRTFLAETTTEAAAVNLDDAVDRFLEEVLG